MSTNSKIAQSPTNSLSAVSRWPKQPTLPFALMRSLILNKYLILQMTKREIASRYRGSLLGFTWSFINPLALLVVYTFVFSQIFHSRWTGVDNTDPFQSGLIFFVGLIIQNFFAEVLNRSPTLIISNNNYVKRVVFPLEILPVITLCTALFNAAVSILVLLVSFLLLTGHIHLTLFFLPIILFPLCLFTAGLAWIFSALGVFLRDIGQFINLLTIMLVFLSPVFYPITAVPEKYRPIILANPLTFIIEQMRDIILWGNLPNWKGLSFYMLVACIFAWLGYSLFQKTRKGFADVI
ncbi:ABC transporter permease [Legionella gresilensis]|uniref:ABC transporter permease n=1 Tax=Legionella gresilensis TaxID=91823 RepID=UPI00104144B8|nr:ABC transporter permease [Legionella gresilensis]